MNRAKVFCVPSVEIQSGASEGFGIVFAEAQSMGLPVASFSTGGISEAVKHQETGLLAPQRDFRKLAAHIHLLLTDGVAWSRMSNAGREHVKKNFDLANQTRLLKSVYDDVAFASIGRPKHYLDGPDAYAETLRTRS